MATKIPVEEMKRQWKSIIISLLGIVGIVIGSFTIGMALFGKELVLATAPLWAGGNGALVVMRQAAEELNLPNVVVAALMSASVQFLIGYPLTTVVLRKEVRRLHSEYQDGTLKAMEPLGSNNRFRIKALDKLQKFSSPTVILLKLTLISAISVWLSKLTGINQMVLALVIGFAATLIGFLDADALGKAKSDGLCMTFMLAFMFCSLSVATPEVFFSMIPKIVALGAIATAGLYLMGFVASRIFKDVSFSMCMGIIFNCYYGFPANVILTEEAINSIVDDAAEREILSSHMMPKMLVGGFTSVTFASVFLAGICANMLAGI